MIFLRIMAYGAVIGALTMGTCLFGVSQAAAQVATPSIENPPVSLAFEIFPKGKLLGDFFEPEIEAGESTDLVVVLANTGSIPFTGRTYSTNAFTGTNGGFAVADAGTEPNSVTRWLDYPEEVYSIEPGQGIERTFTVSVPADTEPGQYLTSLILENAEPLAIDGSSNFEQLIRFAVPVFITVPGPTDSGFEIGEITLTTDTDVSELEIEISNIGDIRVRPSGTITLSREGGEQLFTVPVAMGSVYARETTTLVSGIPVLEQGNYRVVIELMDDQTDAKDATDAIISSTAPATPEPPPPLQFTDATGTPQPSAEDVQFLEVSAKVENTGEPLTNAQVVLRVTKDGEQVEDYPIASSLSIPVGPTEIQERYIPAEGWSTGTWEFTLSLEAVEPGSGVAQVVATAELELLVVK